MWLRVHGTLPPQAELYSVQGTSEEEDHYEAADEGAVVDKIDEAGGIYDAPQLSSYSDEAVGAAGEESVSEDDDESDDDSKSKPPPLPPPSHRDLMNSLLGIQQVCIALVKEASFAKVFPERDRQTVVWNILNADMHFATLPCC